MAKKLKTVGGSAILLREIKKGLNKENRKIAENYFNRGYYHYFYHKIIKRLK